MRLLLKAFLLEQTAIANLRHIQLEDPAVVRELLSQRDGVEGRDEWKDGERDGEKDYEEERRSGSSVAPKCSVLE